MSALGDRLRRGERNRKVRVLEQRLRPRNQFQAFCYGINPPWVKPLIPRGPFVLYSGGTIFSRPKPLRFVFKGGIPADLDPDYDWKIEHDLHSGEPVAVGTLKG